MVFIATTHENEAGLDKKLIQERCIKGSVQYFLFICKKIKRNENILYVCKKHRK